ncbi:unnamed protein product [Effrenium voratum]|nr:unnamed protein product [Effrenium voratum]
MVPRAARRDRLQSEIMDSKVGKSILDMRDVDEAHKKQHVLEVIVVDCAGNQKTRRSVSSFQICLDGNLVESKVRGPKAMSLSSVGGCSKAMFRRRIWSLPQIT